jgi:hypothetical protein
MNRSGTASRFTSPASSLMKPGILTPEASFPPSRGRSKPVDGEAKSSDRGSISKYPAANGRRKSGDRFQDG